MASVGVIGSISAALSVPPEGRIAGSFPERRLVIEPTGFTRPGCKIGSLCVGNCYINLSPFLPGSKKCFRASS